MAQFQQAHGRYLDLSLARVLVIEDSAAMRRILKTVLNGLGISAVAEARSAEEATPLLGTSEFDLILLDEVLDDGRGWALARQIRGSTGPNREQPIIMVSGNAQSEVIVQARDAGVDEFVVKPLSVTTLAQRVEAVLTRRRRFIATTEYSGPDRRRQRRDTYRGPERRTRPRHEL